MINEANVIPSHMLSLINEEGNLALLARYLDCYCVAALFFAPELLGKMGEDAKTNTALAQDFLFRSDKFTMSKAGDIAGEVNLFFPAWHRASLVDHMDSIFHVSVNLPGGRVLTKYGSGRSRCEISTFDRDMRKYGPRGGALATEVAVLVKKVE